MHATSRRDASLGHVVSVFAALVGSETHGAQWWSLVVSVGAPTLGAGWSRSSQLLAGDTDVGAFGQPSCVQPRAATRRSGTSYRSSQLSKDQSEVNAVGPS